MHWIALGIIIAMALLGSLVFAAPSSNSTICFVVATGILLTVARYLDVVALSDYRNRSAPSFTPFISAFPIWNFLTCENSLFMTGPLVEWRFIGLATLYASGLYGGVSPPPACLVFRPEKAVN